jgi:UDP-N-acetylmuramoyl-tripeptide--D-alanyl-D-alanine ligase
MLTEICRPDVGYITNFGKAHLEGFGGVEGVIKGKSELYTWLRNNNKTALVNAEDALQVEKSEGIMRLLFGNAVNADIKIKDLKSEQASAEIDGTIIESNLTGSFHFTNIAAAIALGKMLHVDVPLIKTAIENYNPQMNRSEWRKTERNEILMDAYNANPDSMLATIETFAKLEKPKKCFVLGDMFELGKYSEEEHQLAIERLKAVNAEQVILVGEAFCKTNHPEVYMCFKTTLEAKYYLEKQAIKNCTILLKGSRGMKLENLVDVL